MASLQSSPAIIWANWEMSKYFVLESKVQALGENLEVSNPHYRLNEQ